MSVKSSRKIILQKTLTKDKKQQRTKTQRKKQEKRKAQGKAKE